jgi:indoleamine 2,3-dioxygenase
LQAELKRFGVSGERGFLPEPDPLLRLPAPFAAFEELAGELPRLLPAGRLREAVERLPDFDRGRLGSEAELRRAMLVLSFLGHAFVWGGPEPAARLPAQLARPWAEVASALGRPPVLSYASYALDNWRRLDPEGPIALGNLALLQNFLGGADEDWFVLVHVEIEARAAPLLRAAAPAQAAAREGRPDALEGHLCAIAESLEEMARSLLRMPEWCDPAIYFRRVRPWIHGWKDHPALPGGLLYQGVAAHAGRPQRFRGETGAQSTIVPALDAVLGVEHEEDPLRAYLREMRDYMPPGHRAFLEQLEAGPSVRGAVRAHGASHPALAEAYEGCLHWLEKFRSTHLEYASRYIFHQSPQAAANPTELGTGGTPFMSYLRKHRDETARARRGSGPGGDR